MTPTFTMVLPGPFSPSNKTYQFTSELLGHIDGAMVELVRNKLLTLFTMGRRMMKNFRWERRSAPPKNALAPMVVNVLARFLCFEMDKKIIIGEAYNYLKEE